MKAVEKFYDTTEISLLIGRHPKTVVQMILAGDFGRDGRVVDLAKSHPTDKPKKPDYRVAASAINDYLGQRPVFSEPGIAARNEGELRRKAQVLSSSQ